MLSKQYWLLLLLLVGCAAAAQAYKDYKNYQIYDVIASSEAQQQLLGKLDKDSALDFFHLARQLNTTSKVLVAPSQLSSFLEALNEHAIYHTRIVADVSLVLDAARRQNRAKSAHARLNVFERYYQHGEINAYLDTLAKEQPQRVFVKTFGRSYERRAIKIITISNGDGRADKKVIFVDAAMHAREWITPAMALHIINELLANATAHAALLQHYDWVVLPVANVDGYEYTHTEDRYWRKTRRPNANAAENGCYGTDPNRNFAFQWGLEEGASTDPCDETYMGEHAFSEPETQTVRDIMRHYGGRLKFYLSLHSYGNYLLLPWGHTKVLPANYYNMMDVADAGAMAILFATNSIYSYGNTYYVIYPTSGDSTDYALGVLDVPITIAMELPAGGWSGFDPPPRQIEDIVRETWIGISAMAEVVVNKY